MELAPRLGETSPLQSQAKPSMFGLAWLGLEETNFLVKINHKLVCRVSSTFVCRPLVCRVSSTLVCRVSSTIMCLVSLHLLNLIFNEFDQFIHLCVLPGVKDISVFAPAMCEMSGHVVVYCAWICV